MNRDVAKSFAPVGGDQPEVLILGTMPGQTSLQQAEYYAHPRNALWPILLSVIEGEPVDFAAAQQLSYAMKIQRVCDVGLALWDVLAECDRPGSLDSNIRRYSETANPVHTWLEKQSSVRRVCFNGQTAARLFERHVRCHLDSSVVNRPVQFFTLPSTSPAMATLTLDEKRHAWEKALRFNDAWE